MTPEQIDRVFGRGRLKMVTGGHVEVFREAVAVGERRRYTKRFLNTQEGDYGQWTEREWRILARLIGHGIACVPDVVQFDRGRLGGTQLVQTYDAGVTVDQWATLLPVTRDGHVYRHVFEDCAHWWALAHHCLCALDVIHPLELVHLDIKGDNVCIPYAPASFDPDSSDLRLQPIFAQLSLIDFAFALISRESLTTPLPIGWQKEYDYQSPRLLAALEAGRNGDLKLTRELDWRCDMYSLAAMLKRALPDTGQVLEATGWTAERYDAAKALILRLREAHDSELPSARPHAALLALTGARLRENELTLSLARGWTLMREANVVPASASPLTPVTRVAPVTRLATPVRVVRSGRVTAVTVLAAPADAPTTSAAKPRHARGPIVALTMLVAFASVATALWYSGDRAGNRGSDLQALGDAPRASADPAADGPQPSSVLGGDVAREPSTKVAAAGNSPAAMAPPSPPQAANPLSPALASPTVQMANGSVPLQPAAAATAGPKPNEPPAIGAPSPETPAAVAISSGPANGPAISSLPVEAPAAASLQPTPPPAAAPVPRKSPAAGPATVSRTADESAGVSSSKPTAASRAAENRASTPARQRAAWASLEPPAWLRTGNPPNPPGVTAQESRPGRIAAVEPARAETAAGADPSRSLPAAAAGTPASDAPSRTAENRAPTPARKHAWWASLEPPAWLRSGNPPNPPGVTTQESLPGRVATAEPARAATASVADPPRPQPAAAAATAPSDASSTTSSAASTLAQTAVAPRGPGSSPEPRIDDDFAAQGRRMLAEHVPRIAWQAEPEVARVLGMAASANQPVQERAVADAARLAWRRDDALPVVRSTAPAEARRLNDRARAALASRRLPEAFDLQLQAFGANPRDAELASELALLYLKASPPDPDTARQLALFALATRGPQLRPTWPEAWHTLAVANALGGRETEARNALFVTLALSDDVERTCVAALHAFANYGERLRVPVEAMLYRLHTQGRGNTFAACAWPPPPPPALRLIGRALTLREP